MNVQHCILYVTPQLPYPQVDGPDDWLEDNRLSITLEEGVPHVQDTQDSQEIQDNEDTQDTQESREDVESGGAAAGANPLQRVQGDKNSARGTQRLAASGGGTATPPRDGSFRGESPRASLRGGGSSRGTPRGGLTPGRSSRKDDYDDSGGYLGGGKVVKKRKYRDIFKYVYI